MGKKKRKNRSAASAAWSSLKTGILVGLGLILTMFFCYATFSIGTVMMTSGGGPVNLLSQNDVVNININAGIGNNISNAIKTSGNYNRIAGGGGDFWIILIIGVSLLLALRWYKKNFGGK